MLTNFTHYGEKIPDDKTAPHLKKNTNLKHHSATTDRYIKQRNNINIDNEPMHPKKRNLALYASHQSLHGMF